MGLVAPGELFPFGATLNQSEGDRATEKTGPAGSFGARRDKFVTRNADPEWPQAAPPRAIYMQAKAREVYVPPVLQDLRAGTAELHIALEKRLPFFSDTLDTQAFERLMQAYYGFYRPLEQALQASNAIPDDFDLTPRLKTATLRADLQALGASAEALASLPLCDELPRIDSSAACLGVLYVLEGATLGGQILRREIAARLGLEADNGAAFLDVYGAATGRRWREFIEYLGSRPMDAAERAAVVRAAQTTFSCFEQWLERREVLA